MSPGTYNLQQHWSEQRGISHTVFVGEFTLTGHPGLIVRAEAEWTDEGLAITDLQIRSEDSEAPVAITPALLRSIQLGSMSNSLAARIRADDWQATREEGERLMGRSAPSWWVGTTGGVPGRKGNPVTDLVTLAEAFVELVESGSRSPIKDLSTQSGIGTSTLKARLRRCRELGLLTDAPGRGTAGGELTEKAKAILRGEHPEAG